MAPRRDRPGLFLVRSSTDYEVQPSRASTSGGQLGRSCSLGESGRGRPPSLAPTDLLSSFQVREEVDREIHTDGARFSSRETLVLDPQVGPERPPHDLRLGTALLGGALFEGILFVLVKVGGLPGKAARGGVLLSRAWRSARLRHTARLDKIRSGSIQSRCMHIAATKNGGHRTNKGL